MVRNFLDGLLIMLLGQRILLDLLETLAEDEHAHPPAAGVVLRGLQFPDRLGIPLGLHVAVAEFVLEEQIVRIPLHPALVELHVLLEVFGLEFLFRLGVFGLADLLPQAAELAVFPFLADVDVAVGKLVCLGQQFFGLDVAVVVT